jgi:hypothetical protein
VAALDDYTIKARFWPGLLTGLPAAAGLSVIIPDLSWQKQLGTGVGGILVFAFLLAQIARSRGKRLEPRLFELWGGKPSVRLLRHRDTTIDVHTKARYHRNIEEISGGKLRLPSAAQESEDPHEADQVYEAATKLLIARTRDKSAFPLLYSENVNYGFHRNMWGFKPFGIAASLIGLALAGWRLTDRVQRVHEAVTEFRFVQEETVSPIVAAVISLLMLAIWAVWVRPEWVKIPANAYAERLLEASDSLAPRPTARKQRTAGVAR